MKTRSEEEMFNLILDFAKNDKRIRIVLLNGSRANPNIPKDIFQDYDVVCVVTDVNPFKNKNYIINHFGDTIYTQIPEDKLDPPPRNDGNYNYNMQFIDGNRMDLTFVNINILDKQLEDSLTKVLLDKDNMIKNLPEPSELSYFISKPTEKLYFDYCDEFIFGIASHLPKTMWRKELPLIKIYIEVVLRKPLLKMIEWKIGIDYGFNKTIGKCGKYLQKYISKKDWSEYKKTFSDSDFNNIWKSIFILCELFKKFSKSVAKEYSFCFPDKELTDAIQFLKHVKDIPDNAKSIYN